jgi:hypothetical protein
MRFALSGHVQEAEFGGAFAGFIATLILLTKSYNRIHASQRIVIRGNVLFEDHKPVTRAIVSVDGIDREKLTDRTGYFAIEVDAMHEWTVRASFKGAATSKTVRVAEITNPVKLVLPKPDRR